MSESDQSECESCASDGSHGSGSGEVKRKSKKSKNQETYISPPSNNGNTIGNSWEAISAKLTYEKHLQDVSDSAHHNEVNSDFHGVDMHHDITLDHSTEFGEIPVPSNQLKGGNNGNSSKPQLKPPKSIFVKSHDTAALATGNAGISQTGVNTSSNGNGHHNHHSHHAASHIHFSNSPLMSPKPGSNNVVNSEIFAGELIKMMLWLLYKDAKVTWEATV